MTLVAGPGVIEWVAAKAEADPRMSFAAIGWQRDGELTSGIFYENYTNKSVTCTFAMATGAVMAKAFLRAIFDYPFNNLGVWKMVALVAESNYKSQTMVEKMGFVREATVADYYPDGDLFIYTMTKLQCRFLQEQEDGQEISQDA